MGIFDGAVGAGLGGALSRQAERMDLERRSQQAFDREKEMTKYRLEQEELAARSAWAQGGSKYMANEADVDAHRRKVENEQSIAYEYKKKGYKVVLNRDGTINRDESGPEINAAVIDMEKMQFEASLNRPNPKTGMAQEPKRPMFGATSTGSSAPAPAPKRGKPKTPAAKPTIEAEAEKAGFGKNVEMYKDAKAKGITNYQDYDAYREGREDRAVIQQSQSAGSRPESNPEVWANKGQVPESDKWRVIGE